jgi:tetraacyldisaccharide 4'-kinase
MPLKTPSFWYDAHSPAARLKAIALGAASALYGLGHLIHQNAVYPVDIGIPVICVGNLVAGGSGKTPAAIAIMNLIRKEGRFSNPCFLSRGYGGKMHGPLTVEPLLHIAGDVGDEPLLLAEAGPTIVCANRSIGAFFAKERGHDLIIMDDGLQNPTLGKTLSIVVIDGASGFGNEMLLPSGPLRTPIAHGLRRADAVLLIGEDKTGALRHAPETMPVLRAKIAPATSLDPHLAYIAFCGIAHPAKFRATLMEAGLKIMEFHDFPDHHFYSTNELASLQNSAITLNARLVTTAKDAARLSPAFIRNAQIAILPVKIEWMGHSEQLLADLAASKIRPGGEKPA